MGHVKRNVETQATQLKQIHAVIPLQSPDDEDAPDISEASQDEPRTDPVSTERSFASSNVENDVPGTVEVNSNPDQRSKTKTTNSNDENETSTPLPELPSRSYPSRSRRLPQSTVTEHC